MNIPPLSIDESGPGIDLTNQPDGIAIQMSDPVTDFEYALNAVTLTFELVGAVAEPYVSRVIGVVRWMRWLGNHWNTTDSTSM